MKRISPVASLFIIAFISIVALAQEPGIPPDTSSRPRSVTPGAPTQQQPSGETEKPGQNPAKTPQTEPPASEVSTNDATARPKSDSKAVRYLTPEVIQSRISEAERQLKSRPLATALTTPSIEFVTVAALDRSNATTHLITLSKEVFLKKGSEISLRSSLGAPVTVRVLRANGVNTALTVTTADGKSLVPLVVEYPIERAGLFREMAYYTSAHPALLSQDLVRSGQSYVRDMLDLAAKRLKEKGVFISPDIVNVAERLCIVEHVDHDRFKQENRLALFDEIYSLYALNDLNTYRYSVSVAGAGGMVQMIPWAYNLERQRHIGVGLIPDFVTAMRNHGNALQAMLLYMQDTWNDLAANEDIKHALDAKLATTSEILAAGYNSNAAKLPGYIRRGGGDWKVLIPRETQMYLQIYKTFEALVPTKNRSSVEAPSGN